MKIEISFNYIITIHNKENLVEAVLTHVIECMSENSETFAVLDGCTDGSESIIDEIICRNPHRRIHKVYENDVHELKSINAALKIASQNVGRINIILQDDVLLIDPQIESYLKKLFESDQKMGVVSLRHGANLSRSLFSRENIIPIMQHIESEAGHNPNYVNMLCYGYFIYKEVAIKSPICIPAYVIKQVGIPDERFAPWDDIAYCYKVSQAGYNNGVLAVPFRSDIDWGTTRKKNQKNNIYDVQQKNLLLFKQINNHQINTKRQIYNNTRYKIFTAPHNYKVSWIKYLKGLKSIIIEYLKFKYHIWIK
jgi:glycosyltransferase involved in cell wall biosynthesis